MTRTFLKTSAWAWVSSKMNSEIQKLSFLQNWKTLNAFWSFPLGKASRNLFVNASMVTDIILMQRLVGSYPWVIFQKTLPAKTLLFVLLNFFCKTEFEICTKSVHKIWSIFFKWAIPGLFFVNFCLFKQTLQFLKQTNITSPSSIQCWDSNQWDQIWRNFATLAIF